MIIRQYRADDLDAMCSLMADLGYPTEQDAMMARLERMQQDASYHTFMAEHDGEVVGMAGVRLSLAYEIDDIVVQISALVIKRQYQNRGFGKQIIHHVEQWAKQQGSTHIVLTSGIKAERQQAHQFYKNAGFQITGYRFAKDLNH